MPVSRYVAVARRSPSTLAPQLTALKGWIASLLIFTAMTVLTDAYAAQAKPLEIVTSFSILADMTRQVAGADAHITTLVGPDGDAHVYEPTPADVRAIARADILIVNGLGFEGWLDRLTQAAEFHGHILVASDGITPLMTGDAPDPHAWQNLANGERYVANIEAALNTADPRHTALYTQNAKRYELELKELDRWVRAQMASLPPEQRRAITSHDAMRYFAQAYGVIFLAPLGISTAGDVSAQTVAGLIDQIRASHVRAMFLENMTDPRLIKQLVQEGGAVIGGTLYSDALSGLTGEAPTYTAMFRHNVNIMTDAMRKNIPR